MAIPSTAHPANSTQAHTSELPQTDPVTDDVQPSLNQAPIQADTTETAGANANQSDENDSAYGEGDDTSIYTTSLMSAVREHRYENGRRYHSYREGEYVMPNDETEQDRQDLLHHVRNLVLGGALSCAPFTANPQRVLDVGTGTGIWAIDFADQYPSAEVIGTDLSPIQPSWVPPNLHFQVDDAEDPWLFNRNNPFDYIHMRDLGGSIRDWPKLQREAYEHLKPGGWFEIQEFEVTLKSDDDTMPLAPALCEYLSELHRASDIFQKPFNIAAMHEQWMVETGFEQVKDETYKVPSSGWPKDRRLKEIGRYNLCSLLMAVESYSLALFTRVLGWSNEQAQIMIARVRADLKNPKVHSYCNLHIVYGRKPLQS